MPESVSLRHHAASRHPAEHGQAIVWVAVMLPFFLAIVGLAIDGGIVFGYRRELQNLADGAARAGAMQIDQRIYRTNGIVALDERAAREVAIQYLSGRPILASASVSTDERRVLVEVGRDVPTSFLSLVGITTVRVSARAPAEARAGIAEPGR